MRVRDLVTRAPAFRGRNNQTAPAQARQMIGDIRTCEIQFASELSWIARHIQERKKDPRARRVCHRATETVHHIKTRSNSQHTMTIQAKLTNHAAWADRRGTASASRL